MMKYDGHQNSLYLMGLTHHSAKFQHKQDLILITHKMAYAQNIIIS